MSRNYKFYNPIELGLVFKLEDYVYSSVIDYVEEKGLLDKVILPHDTIVR